MDPTRLDHILRLRLAVGALGERVAPPWWRTQILSGAGARMAARLFPRTSVRAGLETVTLAAAREHDPHVGPQRFHLFRLPQALEGRLQDLLEDPAHDLQPPPDDLQALLESLDPASTKIAEEGPRSLGSLADLPACLDRLAALYAAAARAGLRVYPYFQPEDGA